MRETKEEKLERLTQLESALWANGRAVAGMDEVGQMCIRDSPSFFRRINFWTEMSASGGKREESPAIVQTGIRPAVQPFGGRMR